MRPLAGSRAVLAAVAVLAACGGDRPDTLAVRDAWMPQPAGDTAAVYLTVRNDSGTPDRLVGVSASFAERAELQRTEIAGGQESMRRLDAIAVAANETVTLEPAGLHIMLMGVTPGIRDGQEVSVRLTFERAGDRDVTVRVRPLGSAGGGKMPEHDGMGSR